MHYSFFYIKNLSSWLDLRILVGTIKAVLFGRNRKKPLKKPTFDAERMDKRVVVLKGRSSESATGAMASTSSETPHTVDLGEGRRRST
jgi:hypothetical protein